MQFDIKPPLIHDLIRLHGKWLPNKLALIDEEKTLTWRELDQRSNQVANGLLALGIKSGDSVAILMTNCVEYVEIMYAIFKAGAVVVPLNLAVNEQGLINMLNDSQSKVLFATPEQAERLTGQLNQVPALTTSIIYQKTTTLDGLDYETWRDAEPLTHLDIDISDNAPCNIIYSSGTTGQPKGIKQIHRRRIQATYELALANRYHQSAISICSLGMYSNIAMASVFCPLVVGGTCVIQKDFTPTTWIETVKKYQVTHTMMVPIQFQRILEADNFSPDATSSLEAIISGGSPLFASLKKEISDNFRCVVIELYGLTEGFNTTLQPEDAEGRLSSVGKPFPGHDYIILDDDDNELPWPNTGEICARSISWMTEYHNRPDATLESTYIDKNGMKWLRTGDIGRIDEEGFLYIVDRKKDMILSGGQNIYPADIESVMLEHPAISEVAVIGLPDQEWGEIPMALVVLKQGEQAPTTNQIIDWTNQKVGKRQRIKRLEFRVDLPRNPNGKILKRELRKDCS
ncbi:AMP-binding protein [Paraglaciecola sp. 20A4]|uniref:class I adenylate-forming enzyme family protein n=1 Tax=Paraglaciecola sp. 20A4 TaxID=2687288 RepID=UPI00140B5E00|nr:AMP-binding protein [Paraglaciecola sp. 20A4]